MPSMACNNNSFHTVQQRHTVDYIDEANADPCKTVQCYTGSEMDLGK